MVNLSPGFTPALLKGIVVHPENPLTFDFIVYKGDRLLTAAQKSQEYTKLIKYFLASLAIPDDDQWVNLSPYEKHRIIKDDFGKTEMGRDLLAQDYLLKQVTSSLIYPEGRLGKEFWRRVYAQAQEQYGTTGIPVNTFNKVWILPDDALIYEKGNTAYVLRNHLRVMLEEDYLSLRKHSGIQIAPANRSHAAASRIVREIVLPALQKEVNEGANFAALRQVYSGMLLAAWFKHTLKASLLGQIYANRAKVKGIDQDPRTNEEIYRRYLQAYKKGVFNFIKEDLDKYSNEVIPRKYFSGGAVSIQWADVHRQFALTAGQEDSVAREFEDNKVDDAMITLNAAKADRAMLISRRHVLKLLTMAALAHSAVPKLFSQQLGGELSAKYGAEVAGRLERIFSQDQLQKGLTKKEESTLNPVATLVVKMDPARFALFVEAMDFGSQPATLDDFRSKPYVHTSLDVLELFSDPNTTALPAKVKSFEQLFVMSGDLKAARQRPDAFYDFLNRSTEEDMVFFSQVLQELPDLFNPQSITYPVSRNKIEKQMRAIENLPFFEPIDLVKGTVADTEKNRRMKYLLRRYFLNILLYFQYRAPIDESHRVDALSHYLLASIVSGNYDQKRNATYIGEVGYKILLNKELAAFLAHETGHNVSLFGSLPDNLVVDEFVGDLYANFFAQASVKYAAFYKDLKTIERELGWGMLIARSATLLMMHTDIMHDEHHFARQQQDLVKKAFKERGWTIDWQQMFFALSDLEKAYKDKNLSQELMRFIDHPPAGATFDLGIFIQELLKRYFQRINQPMPQAVFKTHSVLTDQGPGAIRLFEGFSKQAGDKAMTAELQADKASLTKGGIDFNSANLSMLIKRDGRGVVLPLAQQDLAGLSQIDGLVPRIIAIKPAREASVFPQLYSSAVMAQGTL